MDTSEQPHRIALVHEAPIVRSALVRLLHERGQYQLVAEAPDPPGLKRALAVGAPPAVVLLSLEWAQAQGCSLLQWLTSHGAEARVLVIGPIPDDRTLLRLLGAGAHGFCCTRQGLDRIYTILDHVRAGALHFPAHVYTLLRGLLPVPSAVAVDAPALSDRQRIFLRWVASPEEPSYAAIAGYMKVSISTVHKYRATLFKRYNISSKAGLLKLALDHGLGRGAK
jgi:DNA-binding NarL/FixJ family response regulator